MAFETGKIALRGMIAKPPDDFEPIYKTIQ